MLAPWKKSNDKSRQCIKKQRLRFANKCLYSQSSGFSSSHVQMWELDHKKGWALKNWCFWTVVLEKTLESPWTARRSNQSIWSKEINPEYSLEGLVLKLQSFDHLLQRADSLENTLMLGKTECKRRRGWQRMRWLDSINIIDMNLSKLWEIMEDRGTWNATVHEVTESEATKQLNNQWTINDYPTK